MLSQVQSRPPRVTLKSYPNITTLLLRIPKQFLVLAYVSIARTETQTFEDGESDHTMFFGRFEIFLVFCSQSPLQNSSTIRCTYSYTETYIDFKTSEYLAYLTPHFLLLVCGAKNDNWQEKSRAG